MNSFAKLQQTEHMLKWFADDPYAAIRSSVEDILKQQVADSRLIAFSVLSEPQWLTGARPSSVADGKVIVVRSAVAFEFSLSVESHGELHHLAGVYTLAGVNLDQPGKHKHRLWMDLGGTLAAFGSDGELNSRLYFE